MKTKHFPFLWTALITLTVLSFQGCKDSAPVENDPASNVPASKPVVYVPVPPYQYVFERLAGDLIDLRVIAGEGDDPHSYSPTPKQVADMAQANLLCSGELGFEGNYFVKVGDGTNGPKQLHLLEHLNLLEGHCDHPSHKTESTEDDHDHEHEDLNDPHVWLSPATLLTQVDYIAAELKQLLPPEKAGEVDENLTRFKEELTQVQKEVGDALASHQGLKFYVYHGAFAYFARDFGVEQIAIEIANRSPTARQLATIVEQAKTEGVKLIFVQPQFDPTSATALAESIGGRVAPLDPLKKDIIANLRNIAKAITEGTE